MQNVLIDTPAFVFDIKKLVDRVSMIKENLKGISICYAMKANPFLVKDLIGVVDAFEVCSPGEYQLCKALNVPKDKIVLSGVFKEEEDISNIVKECKDLPIYTVESLNQLDLLDRKAKENNLVLNVYLRLSGGNQFGMDEDVIKSILENRKNYALNILGLQSYTGTQKKDAQIEKELDYLAAFTDELESEYDINFKNFEYGPGLRVNYFKSDAPINDEDLLKALKDNLSKFEKKHITLEMGRFIAAYCGEYHTKIVDLKETKGVKYCIVDGGINHLNYFGQMMAMKAPFILENENGVEDNYTICGSLCTVADVLVRNYPLHDAKIGDKLVFLNVGAYSITEGIYLFLSRNMPKIYKRNVNGELDLVRDTIKTYTINM